MRAFRTYPANFSALSEDEQRRLRVKYSVEDFEAGDPDAWYELLQFAVEFDPHIPPETKRKLRNRLYRAMQGDGTIDPYSTDRRAQDAADGQIYAELRHTGLGIRDAARKVAAKRGVSSSTIRRAYERFISRCPSCVRIDGRRKRK